MSNWHLTKETRTYNGAKTVSSINSVGKTGLVDGKKETRPPTYTVHKNKLKMGKRLKSKSQIHKNPRRKYR